MSLLNFLHVRFKIVEINDGKSMITYMITHNKFHPIVVTTLNKPMINIGEMCDLISVIYSELLIFTTS